MVTLYNIKRTNDLDYSGHLSSPAKQCSFLLGLMLTTTEPKEPADLDQHGWNKAVDLLNEIFHTYLSLFWPTPEELPTLSDEWRQVREVAMPAFLHYFNTGLLASTEQVSKRVRDYLVPFDEVLVHSSGISASETLTICDWITRRIESSLEALQVAFEGEKNARHALLDRAQSEDWNLDQLRAAARGSAYEPIGRALLETLDDMFRIRLPDLRQTFASETAETYWRLFTIGRGEVKRLTYLTERNIAEVKPLVRISAEESLCPSANALYTASLLAFEETLLSSRDRDAFLRARDRALEQEAEEGFRQLLGESAQYLSGVFETPDRQYEHDLVVRWGTKCLVVEAKASPPVEPFRDPERAFVRIKRAFQSDTGVQKAFDQAIRIWRKWRGGKLVELFDTRGTSVAFFDSSDVDELFCVCVTRDDFGPLATDLSLLLEKEADEPYLWAVNAFDLNSIAEAWRYFGWGPDRLLEYLRDRIRLHGKVIAFDELELVGFLIQHGTLAELLATPADHIQLNPHYSDVFDRIYGAQHYGGEPVVYEPKPPFMADLRRSLQQGYPVPPLATTRRRKQRRNQPCACGSGKKFKHCCGRHK